MTSYEPSLTPHVDGNLAASLLVVQALYRQRSNSGRSFYKFMQPAPSNPRYRPGDSWCEELGLTSKQLRTALSKCAQKLTKADPEPDPKKLLYYCFDRHRTPYWKVNEKLVLSLIAPKGISVQESDPNAPGGNTLWGNKGPNAPLANAPRGDSRPIYKDPFPSVPSAQESQVEVEVFEVDDPFAPDLEPQCEPEKEKSSAKKEKPAITLADREAQARQQLRRAEQQRRERGAAIRTFQPVHQDLTDEFRSLRRDELLRWLTEDERGRSEWECIRSAIQADTEELTSPLSVINWLVFEANLTAEVISSNRKLLQRMVHPAGVELNAERERKAKRQQRQLNSPGKLSARRNSDGRVKDCPSRTNWNDLSDLLPPSSARPAQTA